MTGRNEKLALMAASELGATASKLTAANKSMFSIAIDMFFGRVTKVDQKPDISGSDLVILFAPIWMGKAASPLRAVMRQIKEQDKDYIFATLSGGATSRNPGLTKDLVKQTGKEPKALIDLYVADLLTDTPTRESTQNYPLSDEEYKQISDKILAEIRKHI